MEVIPSSSRLLLWLISSLLVLLLARAHSVVPEPLSYLEFVTSPIIEILPRSRFDPFKPQPIIRRDIEDDSSLRHDDLLRIQFIAFNRTFSLHLEPNFDLFHPEATITIHHSNNTKTITRLGPEDHRLYKGVLLDIDSTDNRLNEDIVGLERLSLLEELSSSGVLGWARIQVHDDGGATQYRQNDRCPTFEGTFSLYNELYHIKSIENFKITQFKDDPEIPNPSARHHVHRSATMVIYRDSDIKNTKRSLSDEGSCAMDDIVKVRRDRFESNQNLGHVSPWWGSLRIGDKLTKRDVTGCPTGRKIAYMGAAADCTYVTNYNSADNARKQILQDWSTASVIYEKTFNVTLGLIKMEILDSNCPTTPDSKALFNRQCDDSYTINDRLSDFSQWRGNTPNDGASLWHLMSKCNTGPKVGVAWLKQLCSTDVKQQDQQGQKVFVSGTGVSTIVKDEWKVVAHEVGHGFGAIHDCTADFCPCTSCQCCPLSDTICNANAQYLMNPTSNVATDQFSPCSITDICGSLPTIGSCLEDPGSKSILSQSMCGNGLKEDNEECDCGSDCADDPCCDGSTCKLRPNAICSDKNDMCCKNCQFRPANEVCRPASSNCDVPEVCSGTSGDCPLDKHVKDGTDCAPNLSCAGGQCTSRDNQCKSRGGRMGITKACSVLSDQSCDISCASPNETSVCLKMSGSFVDGTPCGFGGRCSKGKCNTDNLGNAASDWINRHKTIVIIVSVIIGSLVLCCIIQCVHSRYKKRTAPVSRYSGLSDRYSRYSRQNSDYNHNSTNGYNGYNGYNNNNNNNYGYSDYNNYRNGSKWVDPGPYNGYNERSRGTERSVPMPTPVHQERTRSPDFTYAGTGPIQPMPQRSFDRSQTRSPNPNSSRNDALYNGQFDRSQSRAGSRPPGSPNLDSSRNDALYNGQFDRSQSRAGSRPPGSPNPDSSRSHFVDDTKYNGPRNPERQYSSYRRQ